VGPCQSAQGSAERLLTVTCDRQVVCLDPSLPRPTAAHLQLCLHSQAEDGPSLDYSSPLSRASAGVCWTRDHQQGPLQQCGSAVGTCRAGNGVCGAADKHQWQQASERLQMETMRPLEEVLRVRTVKWGAAAQTLDAQSSKVQQSRAAPNEQTA